VASTSPLLHPGIIAAIVFVLLVGGAGVGMALRQRLPADHLSADSRDSVKLAMGLIATMAALVLGLLIASAKSAFDTTESEFREMAANVLLLDRLLAGYGPDAKDARDAIRQSVARRLEALDAAEPPDIDMPGMTSNVESIEKRLRALMPASDEQTWLKTRAVQVASDVARTRWLVLGSSGPAIQMPFLVVLAFWLSALFASFGLFAPRNGTVMVVLVLSAASVATAIFLILEMGSPFAGVMRISSAPLRYTFAHLGE
jgi:hypothetical protein